MKQWYALYVFLYSYIYISNLYKVLSILMYSPYTIFAVHPSIDCDICPVLSKVTGYHYHSNRSPLPFSFTVIVKIHAYVTIITRYQVFYSEAVLCLDYYCKRQSTVSRYKAGTKLIVKAVFTGVVASIINIIPPSLWNENSCEGETAYLYWDDPCLLDMQLLIYINKYDQFIYICIVR